MDDTISRQQTINSVLDMDVEHRVSWKDAVIDVIDELPSSQPRGQWKRHPNEREYDICTNCQTGVKRREYGLSSDGHEWVTEVSYRFCPYCGARMGSTYIDSTEGEK